MDPICLFLAPVYFVSGGYPIKWHLCQCMAPESFPFWFDGEGGRGDLFGYQGWGGGWGLMQETENCNSYNDGPYGSDDRRSSNFSKHPVYIFNTKKHIYS